MKVKLKYDRGLKPEEVVTLEVNPQELETMVEHDYRQRLARATCGEVVLRRTPQNIFDEMNRQERNSWQTHHRHLDLVSHQQEDNKDFEMVIIADHSWEEARQRQEAYEDICQKIRLVMKPEQANMIIAICLDGMAVKEYALQIGDTLTNVSQRFSRAKKILRERLIQSNH